MVSYLKKEKCTLYLIFISLSFFLFSIYSVDAIPPVQVSDGTGMQIEYPKVEYVDLYATHRFHAHVINETATKTNRTTSCYFHLYNQSGFDFNFSTQMMEWESYNELDFAFTVEGGNFSTAGLYSYVIQCNSSNEIAFASGEFEVNSTGAAANSNFYWIILLVSAGLIILGFAMKDPSLALFGTFGLYFVAIYILFNGIVGVKDLVTTWAIGIILLGVAAYISIRSAYEIITESE